MTRAYSNDLRERVVRAHLAGEPIRSVAARYGVSVSSVPKWVARWRATGSVVPDKIGGHRSWRLEPHRERVRALVGETPHLTIDRLQDLLAAQGIPSGKTQFSRWSSAMPPGLMNVPLTAACASDPVRAMGIGSVRPRMVL